MTESCLIYKPWQSLDPEKQYCLVDTMVLLQIYRRNLRLTAMADAVRGDKVLLLIPAVVDECFSVFHTHKPDTASAESIFVGDESGDVYEHFLGPVTHEDFVVEPKSRSEFDCLLAEGLDEWEIEFTAFKPNSDTLGIAKKMHGEKLYKNKKGEPISLVDCIILRLAIENQNIDVLTDDAALAKATLAECGLGRASHALTDYFGRLNMTAYFLSSVLDVGFIDCIPIRDRIEYHAIDTRPDETNDLLSRKSGQRDAPDQDSSMLFVIQSSPDSMGAERGPAIRDLKRSDTSDVVFALMRFVSLVVQDWYCACGDPNWAKFDKEWHDVQYNIDTMQTVGKVRKPYYDTAKSILDNYRERYCACARPDERQLHEAFKSIASKDDNDLSERIFEHYSSDRVSGDPLGGP